MNYCAVFSILLVLGLVGCGEDSEPGTTNGNQSTSKTPEELCGEKCDAEVAAGCEKTSATYADDCRTLCLGKFNNYPDCLEEMKALELCATTKVSYSCTASGTVTAMPYGACANEGLACGECTGDFLACI